MRLLVPLLIGAAILAASVSIGMLKKQSSIVSADVAREYAIWKQKFGKLYATPAEADHRLKVFITQRDYVSEANREYNEYAATHDLAQTGPMFALNHFADLTQEEFTVMHTGLKLPEKYEYQEAAIPEATKALSQSGYQVKIYNQGSCGSCWAFGAIATYEHLYFTKTRQRVDFSQQQLVDCDTQSYGCEGGFSDRALGYIKNYGIPLSSQYPYRGVKQPCRGHSGQNKVSFNVGAQPFNSDTAQRLGQGAAIPTVLVMASGKFRYLTGSDVYPAASSGECGQVINHAINFIQSRSGQLQLLNSWGTNWGSGGTKWVTPCASNNLWGTHGQNIWGA